MLALGVSPSANAGLQGNAFCDNVVCFYDSECLSFAPRCESEKHRLPCNQAFAICLASCGRMEGVEHLSPSALRARFGAAKNAAPHYCSRQVFRLTDGSAFVQRRLEVQQRRHGRNTWFRSHRLFGRVLAISVPH
jgi:hypothetical protein